MNKVANKVNHSKRTATGAVVVIAAISIFLIIVVAALEYVATQFEEHGVIVENTASTEPFYVILIGNDSRKETALYTGKASDHAQVDQHSDIVTLMRVDPQTYTITFVSIPRDTYVEDQKRKLSDTLIDGDTQKTIDGVESIIGIRANYYMMTTFSGFHDLIDYLGGVTVDVPMTITIQDPITTKDIEVTEGENQSLNGAEALGLARSRKNYGEFQEALRQLNVRNIETAMVDSVLTKEMVIDELLESLQENTTTNMNYSLISFMLTDFIAHKDEIVIYSTSGPYKGDIDDSDSWVVEEDRESWEAIVSLMDEGEDPSLVVPDPVFESK